MDAYILSRALHVLAVVHWIGGVAMVTLVILPGLRQIAPDQRLDLFERIEGRFGAQARISTLLAGLSGFWMLHETGWNRLLDAANWWLVLMVAVWAIFTVILFVAEPLFLHAWFHRRASRAPERTFALVLRMHRVLLALSAVAVGAGVMGAHGGL